MGIGQIISLTKEIKSPSLDLFQKEKYLGQGGFGDVWKVFCPRGNCYLAMKSLSKRRILKKEFIQNIFTERDILNHLYNAHIVNLYATFQDENNLYMIIDYMQGGDLRKLMSKKILEMKEIKFIAACIIIGLEYIHKNGIIHRDIKPDNLIFDENRYLRISDFGIAVKSDKLNDKDIICDKSGTPGYMAPERIIINDKISYDYSSDYFSLGVILYELITLQKPFKLNYDKIGITKYYSYENVIKDLFNNKPVNLSPKEVKRLRREKLESKNEKLNLDDIDISNLCDLINKLLIYQPNKRFGNQNIDEIKSHIFFGERFRWNKIFHRSIISPFFDITSFYSNEEESSKNCFYEKKSHNSHNDENILNEEDQLKFKNFTSIRKISAEDFSYFYLKGNITKVITRLKNENKYRTEKKTDNHKMSTIFPSKNHFDAFSIKRKNNFNSIKFRIFPNRLFSEHKFKNNSMNHLDIKGTQYFKKERTIKNESKFNNVLPFIKINPAYKKPLNNTIYNNKNNNLNKSAKKINSFNSYFMSYLANKKK